MPTPPIKLKPGDRFGKWTVLDRGTRAPNGRLYYLVQCECGTKTTQQAKVLASRDSSQCRSCGQRGNQKGRTHGHSPRKGRTLEYTVWHAMTQRCLNPSDPAYGYYGGRGILIDSRWAGPEGFANFLKDMGPRGSVAMTLDRIDSEGPYSPSNCRWADRKTQQRNRRDNVWVEVISGTREKLADYIEREGETRGRSRRTLAKKYRV